MAEAPLVKIAWPPASEAPIRLRRHAIEHVPQTRAVHRRV